MNNPIVRLILYITMIATLHVGITLAFVAYIING